VVVADEWAAGAWRGQHVKRAVGGVGELSLAATGPAGRVRAVARARDQELVRQAGLHGRRLLQVVVLDRDRTVRADGDLRGERLDVARRLVDPDRAAPARAAVAGHRERDLGRAASRVAAVLPDRVQVALRAGGELGELVAGADEVTADEHLREL